MFPVLILKQFLFPGAVDHLEDGVIQKDIGSLGWTFTSSIHSWFWPCWLLLFYSDVNSLWLLWMALLRLLCYDCTPPETKSKDELFSVCWSSWFFSSQWCKNNEYYLHLVIFKWEDRILSLSYEVVMSLTYLKSSRGFPSCAKYNSIFTMAPTLGSHSWSLPSFSLI